jgi:hypothetical protein
MELQDAYFEQRFENAFLRAKGEEFQTFFERLMGLAYKADFMACRPWGSAGDRKNDGFLRSQRCLFQVYAPNEMTASKAKAKITEDFEGATEYWGTLFDRWVFVHNATDGLPYHIHDLLLDFEKKCPGRRLEAWGLEELRLIFRELSVEDKISWFGIVPTGETRARLGFEELRVVLEGIGTIPAPIETEVRDVPMGKIEANALSGSTRRLLVEGMVKAPMVEAFFADYYDETLGERLAEAFKAEYRRLRNTCTPSAVFRELQAWAGGDRRGTPEHELAVITVMAYFFERCDVFEEPRRSVL